VERRVLAIYLTDHMAGSTAGLELARRAAASNSGTELGDFLTRLVRQIEEDRDALSRVMEGLGVGADRLKNGLAWGVEKLGRLKLNGQLTGYSPLSRLIELEGLHTGISAKLSSWQALRAVLGPSVGGEDIDALQRRAKRQLDELEPYRLAAAREAFAEEAASSGRATV
jgi:hypothetical protein